MILKSLIQTIGEGKYVCVCVGDHILFNVKVKDQLLWRFVSEAGVGGKWFLLSFLWFADSVEWKPTHPNAPWLT